MTRSKRIAIVFRDMASLSGTPNTIFSHASYLAACGYGVDLVAEKIDRARSDGDIGTVKIRRWPFYKRRRFASFARRADRRLRAAGYDFVAGHGHNAVHDVVSLHNCERLCHFKLHGEEMTEPSPLTLLQDEIFTDQQFTLCIANSTVMRDELVDRYRVPVDKIRVVHPGYDEQRFDPAAREPSRSEKRRELGIDAGHCLIGLVTSGAFEVRGVDIAIDAYAALPDAVRARTRMVIVGKSSRLADYQKQAADLGVGQHVQFLPPMRDIERLYHALDICVHPARFETFGQVVQEAMACRLAVVTNRQASATELLPDAVYAELPETSTVAPLAAELERLIDDPPARAELAQHGYEAVKHNTLERNCELTLEVYREAGL